MPPDDDNPLLSPSGLPRFTQIRAEHVVPAVEHSLASARDALEVVVACPRPPSWDNVAAPVEALVEKLERVWSPVRHLHSVMDSPELRTAYEHCLPKLIAFHTALSQDPRLYQRYEELAAAEGFAQLVPERRRAVEHALRDFRLGGVALDVEPRRRFAEIESRLAELATKFSNNVLDATQAWSKPLSDAAALRGLPDSALALARQQAERAGEAGFRLTLDLPSYLPVLTYADDRALRREAYEAYVTRASELGPSGGRFDNGALMREILELRAEKASLLGLQSYAEYSLEKKMARSVDEVLDFLRDLARRSRPVAERELHALRRFAAERYGSDELEAWDLAYYAEKLKQERFQISQEDLRPYFPVPKVVSGMFRIAEKLFGIRIEAVQGVETWHPDVSFYRILDADGSRCGELYLDPYARTGKRGGAWMDVCRTRARLDDVLQTPVAYLTCNFTPPVGDRPALITHDEVTTLFHEFGHGLHHLLTRVELPSLAGIAGVEWDAVELPSQFLENWCYDETALDTISAHHETGTPLPRALLERLKAARNFQSGMQMLRQIEFALFDFRLHAEYRPGLDPEALLDEVRGEVAVIKPPSFNRFANSFSHVFAGGYAAGYYSYKWAEVLACDAFARFEETSVFDCETGTDFRREILERGGTRDALDSFVAFRGREPRIDALLRHSGIDSCEQPGAT